MPAHDYHPLRLRSVLPGSAHLGELEARAAARTAHGRNASDVEAYLAEIRHLLDDRARLRGGHPSPEFVRRTAIDEALRISKALQWARSAPRVVRVPSAGPRGNPPSGTMRVGGVQLPAACVYVAFSDDFPTPDSDLRIAGVYLGEGGSLEALAGGWVEYVWSLVIAVQRSGEPLGSATASWHASIATADPSLQVSEALARSFVDEASIAPSIHFGNTPAPPAQWRVALAGAVECALQAAALTCVAHVVPKVRNPPSLPGPMEPIDVSIVDLDDGPADPAARPTARDGSAGPRTPAEVVFGPAPPRARNRWLVERHPVDNGAPSELAMERRETPRRADGASKRKPCGHERGPVYRVYHRDTPRQFGKWIEAHPVNGGRPKDIASTVIVDRLDPERRPSLRPN